MSAASRPTGCTVGPHTAVWSAWSCTVRLVVTDPRVLDAAAADLVRLLDEVDRAASRFRPDSALSVANVRAGRSTPVPRLLVELVEIALAAAAATDGALDPTLGRTIRDLGYDRSIEDLSTAATRRVHTLPNARRTSVATEHDARAARPAAPDRAPTGTLPPAGGRPDWRSVRLDHATGLLTVPRGTALDLGATAKAWTADRAAAGIAARHGVGVLVEIGGDLAVAGPLAGPAGWLVRVAERAGEPGPLTTLGGGGMATSTTTIRRWRHGDRLVHHILDPRTGQPADGPWRTATVATGSALSANTASTTAIVLGTHAVDWLVSQRLAARLVAQDGAVRLVGDWPDEPDATRVPTPARRAARSPAARSVAECHVGGRSVPLRLIAGGRS